jgi:hypothetical protein
VFNGITFYNARYEFDSTVHYKPPKKKKTDKKKGLQLDDRVVQSCRVFLNNQKTNPEWSSGPKAWEYAKNHPFTKDTVLAFLRKESMDRSVYTLALLNDKIHVTGDISAMANRALLYKIFKDSTGRTPKSAIFDHGTAGASIIELKRGLSNNIKKRKRENLPEYSNTSSARAMREAYKNWNNNVTSKRIIPKFKKPVIIPKSPFKVERVNIKNLYPLNSRNFEKLNEFFGIRGNSNYNRFKIIRNSNNAVLKERLLTAVKSLTKGKAKNMRNILSEQPMPRKMKIPSPRSVKMMNVNTKPRNTVLSAKRKTPTPGSTRMKTPTPRSAKRKTPTPRSTKMKTPTPRSTRMKTPTPRSAKRKTPTPMIRTINNTLNRYPKRLRITPRVTPF